MKSLTEIKDLISRHKGDFQSKYSLKSIAIFGSYSRGENNHDSDVDILVEFDNSIGIKFIDFAQELEHLLKMKVDVVSRKGVKEKYLKRLEEDLIYV